MPRRSYKTGVVRRETPYERRGRELQPARPHYDPRQAARSYAGICGILAGFAVTAVVLLANTRSDPSLKTRAKAAGLEIPEYQLLIQRASIALILAFFAAIVGAFAYAITSADETVTRRTHALSLYSGAVSRSQSA